MSETRTYSVLYVEDNESNRLLVQLILERKDYLKLFQATDGKSGIQTAQEIHPDLILLDISLPDMNGYDVLAALRNFPATQNTPVIAISGEFPPRIPADAPFVFEKYLAKPIEIVPLYQAIDELLKI